ncbi:MAG: family 20 glycosylhydrolase, partial [Calditrichaeota bacterium]|nr:family 20 glycosylhydrolase [Calditrichota bacterium]
LPALAIADWPEFEMRGVTDDISRGQVSTMENFQAIIRFLAHYKMNIYMPYIEDLFRFKSYPSIGKNRGALSVQECIALQDYAEKYHVEIIPIFQTLGHYENLLVQEEYLHLGDFPGAASLDTTREETYLFLEKVLDEIVPVFRSAFFNMGADESFDVGKGASRRNAERHGIASVHAKHYRRVIDILQKHNKKIMMYGDIVLEYPTILNEIPKNLVMFDWHYEAEEHYPSAEIFRKAGQPFIVSPGVQNWSRIFPDLTEATANIDQFTRDGWENGAIGAITSNWGDFGGANLRELIYYPYAYAAACAWNPGETDIDHFEKHFFRDFYGSDDPGFSNAYHILSKLAEYYDIDNFFANPFYEIKDRTKTIRRSFELDHFTRRLNEELKRLQSLALRNSAHLDYLNLCSEMYGWIGRLNQMKLKLYQAEKYSVEHEGRKENILLLQKLMQALANDLVEIKSKYESLWMRSNRRENLHYILDMMDRVQTILLIKKDTLTNGKSFFDGQLPAPFISHPKAKEADVEVPRLFFRKKIHLDSIPGKAYLQLIADSHAKVWVNEHEIGQVVARRTLSGIVENERVKAWDVSEHLREGENIIAVQVRNYVPKGKAAVNVWFEIPEKKFIVHSDEYWKVCDADFPHWRSAEFDDLYWISAVPVENAWIISRPYFDHGLSSRIEFFKEPL